MASAMRAVCGWNRPGISAAAMAVVIAVSALTHADDDAAVRFGLDVQPILRAHCVQCHGTQEPQGGLNLTTAESLSKGGDNGTVVVPGDGDASLLLQKIVSKLMPPPEENDPLSDAEIAVLRRWITSGADGVTLDAAEQAPTVTDQDRAFWAFRPPEATEIPQVVDRDRVRSPIDAFLMAKLESRGLEFSADAERRTWLRRTHLDLLGLPPPLDDIDEFVADSSPDASERLLDRLLASPHYGERWGRHWLDVAGYTDSPHWNSDKTGKLHDNQDWLYRDYVVRSFNEDKPYDRFLTEQLAGDEIVDWRSADRFTPEMSDALVATGYLRTTPDWTHSEGLPFYRFDTLARVVDNVSTGLLGLTINCARCHSHKFDPIPHEDYYRLMAVFATAYNPDQWLTPFERFVPDISPREKDELDRHNAKLDTDIAEIKNQLDALRSPHRQRIFAKKLANLPQAIRADVETAIATAASTRNEVQKYLVQKFESHVAVSDQELTAAISEVDRAQTMQWNEQIASLEKSRRTFGRIQALCDVGSPPALRQLIRGDPRTPGKVVEPGFPVVLCPSKDSAVIPPGEMATSSSGRRLALAQWLTSRDHPLTSRVMVNRIWQHHFGKGIVATPENFGHTGSAPSHPELLDWLAVDFRDCGWSVKRLHRQIVTATAYRQSARRSPENPGLNVDPENELLWRMNLRRMEAETIRDAVLATSGQLNPMMGGAPIPVLSNPDGLVTIPEQESESGSHRRRTLYVKSLRGSHPGGQGFKLSMLEIFDFPEVVINCTRRSNSTTPMQSLALLHSQFMIDQAACFAERVRQSAASSNSEIQIERAYLLSLARPPSSKELELCVEHLLRQTEVFAQAGSPPEQAAQQALASLCAMLLASNEFLYLE